MGGRNGSESVAAFLGMRSQKPVDAVSVHRDRGQEARTTTAA
jgi:hypothetical protein